MKNTAGRDRATAVFVSTKFLTAFVASFILALSLLFIIKFPYQPGWDFRNNLWAPAFLLIRGQSPYNISILYEMGTAIWMPMAIGVLWPIGFLPLQQASNLWWIVSLVSFIAIVWLSTGYSQPPKLGFVIALFMAFLFPPSISHFSLGQITILICLIFLVITVFEPKLHPFLIAVLIALTLSKPQLTIFVLPGYFFAYLRGNGISRTLKLASYSILAVGITSLPLFFLYPQWISDFVHNQLVNPTWAHPSSLFILQAAFNKTGRVLWWLLLLTGSGLNFWLWMRLPKREALAWSLALTTIITPYMWSWDFILLIPLLISYLFREIPRYSSWILYLGFVACWVVLASMKLTGYTSDELYWWVPWYLIGLILIANSLVWSSTNPRINPIVKLRIPNFLIGDDRS